MQMPDEQKWQVDAQGAEAYEQYLVPMLFAAGAQGLVGLAQLQPGARVLDVACGTGIVARTAAQAVGPTGKVTGVDLNTAMLEVARAAPAPAQPVIEWKQGDASALPVEDGAYDVVCCQQGFQFFPDRPAALREMWRALAPQGKLAMSMLRSLRHNHVMAAFADLLARHVDAGEMMRSPFPDISISEMRTMLLDAGFTLLHLRIVSAALRYPSAAEMLQWEVASSPRRAHLLEMNATARARLVEDIQEAFADHTDDLGITFPIETYIVHATKPH